MVIFLNKAIKVKGDLKKDNESKEKSSPFDFNTGTEFSP